MVQQTWPFYSALAATGMHLAWQIGTVNINDPKDCWKKFKTNQVRHKYVNVFQAQKTLNGITRFSTRVVLIIIPKILVKEHFPASVFER